MIITNTNPNHSAKVRWIDQYYKKDRKLDAEEIGLLSGSPGFVNHLFGFRVEMAPMPYPMYDPILMAEQMAQWRATLDNVIQL